MTKFRYWLSAELVALGMNVLPAGEFRNALVEALLLAVEKEQRNRHYE